MTKPTMRCLACWNDLPAPRAVYTLPCRHVFCLPCAEAAFARELACPNCDTVLPKDGIVEFSPHPDANGLRDIASGVLGLAPADLLAVLTAGLEFLDGARANEDARWACEIDHFRVEGDRVRKEAAEVRERLEVERLSVARLKRQVEEGGKEKAEVQRLYREKVRAGRKVREKYGELKKVHCRLREDLEAAGRVVGEAESSERDDGGAGEDMDLAREREVEREREREIEREVEHEKGMEREGDKDREREREKEIEKIDRESRRERARVRDRERVHRARESVGRGQKRPVAVEPRSHDVGTRLGGNASSSHHDPEYERPRHRDAQTFPVAPRPRDLLIRTRADDERRTRGSRRERKRVEATSKHHHVPPTAGPLAARELRRKSNIVATTAASTRPETADDDGDDVDVEGESRLESRCFEGGDESDRRVRDEPNILHFPLHRAERKTGDTGRSDGGGFRELSPRARVFDLNPGLRKRHRTEK